MKYVVLILATTCVSYTCAIVLEKQNRPTSRRLTLLAALVVCLGILFVFKYYNWTMQVISPLFQNPPKRINLILPVGISFYTFQTLGYVVDVYRGDIAAEKHFGIYATFISFFPQLVAGPIERTKNLLPQIREEHFFRYEEAAYGVRLILWGLYKKVVIADNLAILVDEVYGDVSSFQGFSLVLATLFFTFQIYCDFSGYSDIARGSAMLLGIRLMENFKSPYFSASIREFWSRWHISLSTWFRDYVYIPLGGNRVSQKKNVFNTLTTFLVSGLWHGANATFMAWGGAHGIAQIYQNAYEIKAYKKRDLYWWIRVISVFLFAMLAWVFFRANNVTDALYVFRHMISGAGSPGHYITSGVDAMGLDSATILRIVLAYLMPLLVFDYVSLKCDVIAWLGERKAVMRHVYCISLILLILWFGYFGESTFVYFQF